MTEQLEMQFRPSLIICVGKVGALIREYLSPYQYAGVERNLTEPLSLYHLLSNLDRPLRNSVGLLQVYTETNRDNPDIAIPFPTLKAYTTDDPDIPMKSGNLEEMIKNALRSVQLDRRLLDVRTQGYAVPNTRTQIFIVGEPNEFNTIYMIKILKAARKIAKSRHFDAPICYCLNNYQDQENGSAPAKKMTGLPRDDWKVSELANFSYLYEEMISYPSPVFVSQNESRYAAAEGLFALAATGIASLPAFENAMELSTTLTDYTTHSGNISTSMVMFPRSMTGHYCSARLSNLLMQKWQHDLSVTSIPGPRRTQERETAQTLAGDIESWIEESEPRPLAEESNWPNFGILFQKNHPESLQKRYTQIDAYKQLENQTENLFRVFLPDEIARQYKNRKDKSETWATIADNQCVKADGLYQKWEQDAKKAWQMLSERINAEIRMQVDNRWSENKDGFEVARIYVDALDDQLAIIMDHVRQWRKDHADAYKTEQARFLKLAKGDWSIDEDQPSILPPGGGGGQASPTMGNIDTRNSAGAAAVSTNNGGGGLIGGGGAPSGSGGGPPPKDDIARDLRLRATWKQNHIPPLATLGSTGFMGWLALALSASIPNPPQSLDLAIKSFLGLAFIGGNLFLFLRRLHESKAAQRDALDFYRLSSIHECENREDLQRIDLLRMLSSRVKRMRRRLDDMSTFLSNIRKRADVDAEGVQNQLFHGPAGVRDIFIANGERLQEYGDHTLDSIVAKVEQTRQNHPLEDWHSNFDKMRDELIRRLKQGNETLLEMTEERVQEHLYDFTTDIIDGYLVGSLVDLGAALDKPEVWREILERVRRPLYYAGVGVRDPKWLFVCGNPRDLTRSVRYIPSEAIQIRTKSSEWLMIVAFFSGGNPDILHNTTLFPSP